MRREGEREWERDRERERGQEEDSERDRKWWSVENYVRGFQTNKKSGGGGSQACLTSWLVYMSGKQHREKKLTNETRDFLNPCRARRYLVFSGSKPLSIAHDTFHRI